MGLLNWLTRRSLENPNVAISDPGVWRQYFGGMSMSAAGIAVTEQTALAFSPIWCGITQISSDIAQTPMFVYRRLATGGKDRATDHPAYGLLRRKANEYMTAHQWRRCAIAQAIMHGNHYSWIRRDASGTPLELIPIEPTRVRPQYLGSGPSLELIYKVNVAGRERQLPADQVFHVSGLTLNGIDGLSLLQYGAQSLGRGIAAERYASRFFRNGAAASGVLAHPGNLSKEAASRLQAQFTADHSGDNQFRIAVLEEGMTWTPMGVDPERAQMVATLQFSVKDAARFLNIPPHRLGDDSNASYNSLEQENKSYHETTLGPWFASLREEAWDKLLTEEEKNSDTVTVEELRVSVLRADAAARSAFYHNALLDGWMSRDEVRDLENLNPIPDEEGQQFYIPLNVKLTGEEPEIVTSPADSSANPVGEPQTEPATDPTVDGQDQQQEPDAEVVAAARDCMSDALRRIRQRVVQDRGRVKKLGGAADAQWHQVGVIERHEEISKTILGPPIALYNALGMAWLPADSANRVLEWYRLRFVADDGDAVVGTSNIMEVTAWEAAAT